jgi:hypothetical protein
MGRFFSKLWPISRQRLKAMRDRLCWWYLNWCIARGRIVAGIPEGVLKAEIIPTTDRVTLLLGIGTSAASTPPDIAETRKLIIQAAFDSGFRVLHSPAIGWGATVKIPDGRWMADTVYDQATRQKRQSDFIQFFGNYPLEHLRDYGEKLAVGHKLALQPKYFRLAQAAAMNKITLERYLWRDGLAAEETTALVERTAKDFQAKTRGLLADWVDFDVVAAHYANGFDILCSQDRGKNQSSIFSSQYASALQDNFGVTVMNVSSLVKFCLRQFSFPLTTWRTQI